MKEFLTSVFEKVKMQIRADELLSKYLHLIKTELPICLISIGKASNEMNLAAHRHFGERIKDSLIVCPVNSYDYNTIHTTRIVSSHPLISEDSIKAADIVEDFILMNNGCYLVFLISGGGSALVEKPVSGLDIISYNKLINGLLSSDFNINDINIVRKHLSQFKGGFLLEKTDKSRSFVFILSDVGESVHNVSSGITFCDSSTKDDAISMLRRKTGFEEYTGFLHETPKGRESLNYQCIGDNNTVCQIMQAELINQGIDTIISEYRLDDYANMCGLNIGCQLYRFNKKNKPFALIYGGEPVVVLKNKYSRGGRMQEMALSLAIEMQFFSEVYAICVCTDGKDGSSEASGAYVDCNTYNRINSKGKSVESYLKGNKSFEAFGLIGDYLEEYPSVTNLNDICVVLFK